MSNYSKEEIQNLENLINAKISSQHNLSLNREEANTSIESILVSNKPEAIKSFISQVPTWKYKTYEISKPSTVTYYDTNNTKNSLDLIDAMKRRLDNPEKSELEKLIDEIFTDDEKIDYLLSVGYKSDNMIYFNKDEMNYLLQPAFMKEMFIKMKNILLAKTLLKIKLT